jgi:hypothetical protein
MFPPVPLYLKRLSRCNVWLELLSPEAGREAACGPGVSALLRRDVRQILRPILEARELPQEP